MTEQEAKERCRQLSEEHPDRFTHQWVPTRRGSEWTVAKIGVPPASVDATPEIRAEEKRSVPDDPRDQTPWLNPPGGGIVP